MVYIDTLRPMLNDFTGADKVYIARGYTDLRKGIDGLARLVQQQFELDPFTNTLFLFCGRRRDRIKGLYWEKDGFILLYKRLEQGAYQSIIVSTNLPFSEWLTMFENQTMVAAMIDRLTYRSFVLNMNSNKPYRAEFAAQSDSARTD